jgi:putative PIN family toxin of toxin-antitoxin system
MKYYAVLDTNVLVSSLLSSHKGTAIDAIWDYVARGIIVPLVNDEILAEYSEVLHRKKLGLVRDYVDDALAAVKEKALSCERKPGASVVADPDDVVFYEVSLSRDDAYLITGNLKHFPKNGRIVSPAEMVHIIESSEKSPTILNDPDVDYLTEKKKQLLDDEQALIERARRVTEQIRAQAILNGTADMSMEEIDEEIRLCRQERRERMAAKKEGK